MSFAVEERVWKYSRMKHSMLTTLLCLAKHSYNDSGYCWPGVSRIARHIRLSVRQTQRILRKLEAHGEIVVIKGGGRRITNGYIVLAGLNEWQLRDVLKAETRLKVGEVADLLDALEDRNQHWFDWSDRLSPVIEDDSDFDDLSLEVGEQGEDESQIKRVTSVTERVTSEVQKGDIAVSPESLRISTEIKGGNSDGEQDSSDEGTRPEERYLASLRETVNRTLVKQVSAQTEGYPADVREIIEVVCDLWGLRPPTIASTHRTRGGKRGNTCGYWINGARDLLDACGEFGIEAVKSFHKEYQRQYKERGAQPFPVNSPGSLVNSVRGHTGTMRRGEMAYEERVGGNAIAVYGRDGRIR